MQKHNFGRVMLLSSASLIATVAIPAHAQTAPEAQTAQTAQNSDQDAGQASQTANNQVIIVTGSQIRGAQIDDVLPVTVVDERQIEAINPSSGDELFRAIPQAGAVAFNEQNTTGGINSARGDIASINLRELGTGNTLLLINGRRMVLDPGFQTELLVPVVSPDTNSIAPGSVRRLEVLRDGASAIYGADAVAGVVNTVLRSNRRADFWKAISAPLTAPACGTAASGAVTASISTAAAAISRFTAAISAKTAFPPRRTIFRAAAIAGAIRA